MSENRLLYRVARLPQREQERLRAALEAGATAQLEMEFEILELGRQNSALAWVSGPALGRRGRLMRCRLSAAQWAESLLCQQGGRQPVFQVRWEVLGPLEGGAFGLAGQAEARLLDRPAPSWGHLPEMLGLGS